MQRELFPEPTLKPETRAIRDGGTILYHPGFFPPDLAKRYFAQLRDEVPWKQEATHGRPFPRLTAWFADEGLSYTYSGVTHLAQPWTPVLAEIKRAVEEASGAEFNSLLLNMYRDGRDSIGWHTDAEPELGVNPVVASVSFGAAREFLLRHMKTRERLTYQLGHGSLLVMGGTCQHHWMHSVPKTEEEVGARINLTFRKIIPTEEGR